MPYIEEAMVQFCNLDRLSFAFRYPVDKFRNRHLQDLKLLNVRQLGEAFLGIEFESKAADIPLRISRTALTGHG
jgi:hypothetical protein